VVELSKRIAPGLAFDACGESVGFFKLSRAGARALEAHVAGHVRAGRRSAPHEEALRDMMLAEPGAFGVEDVTGLPWIEIDFPEDVARARTEIQPRVDAVAQTR
jgi:choline kinase